MLTTKKEDGKICMRHLFEVGVYFIGSQHRGIRLFKDAIYSRVALIVNTV